MPKRFYDGTKSGREAVFLASSSVISLSSMLLCPGTHNRYKEYCFVITLNDQQQLSTVFDSSVRASKALNAS